MEIFNLKRESLSEQFRWVTKWVRVEIIAQH